MAITLSTISAIAARKGNEYLREQVNFKSQILAAKAMEKEAVAGMVRVINVQAGGLGSVGQLTGGSSYPTAESKEATQVLARPASFVGHVAIDFDAAELVNGKADSVKLVKNQFELVGKNLGQQLGRAVLDGYLAGVEANATITAGAATISVSDITAFRVGARVEIFDSTVLTRGTPSSADGCSGKVLSVTRDGDGTGSVSLGSLLVVTNGAVTSSTATGTIAEASAVWLPGACLQDSGFLMHSLADLSGSGTVYGTAVSNADWSGTDTSLGGALSLEAMRELCDEISTRSGEEATHCVMHSLAFQDFEQLHASGRRYNAGDPLDMFGKNDLRPEFRGRPVIVDHNCPGRAMFFFNKGLTTLGTWRDFSPLTNGKDMAEISQTQFSYLIKVAGMFNVVCDRRNSVGRLKNITIG